MGYEEFDPESKLVADMLDNDIGRDPALNALSAAPDDAKELRYTPIHLNDVQRLAMVDSGDTSTFISTKFVEKKTA